jgi:glycosyltransferase involved in cell wall biosynthesis
MSAIEAMAAGLPILVSDGVPVGYGAESSGAGRMVPCTVDAFSQMTCELLADFDRLREMGRRGRILVRDRFDIAVVARQMLEQYQAILSQGKPLVNVQDFQATNVKLGSVN